MNLMDLIWQKLVSSLTTSCTVENLYKVKQDLLIPGYPFISLVMEDMQVHHRPGKHSSPGDRETNA